MSPKLASTPWQCASAIHGATAIPPRLDIERLAAIDRRLSIPLVLHGASGLPEKMITASIDHGICKFNVNTEVRQAAVAAATGYLTSTANPELTGLMAVQIEAMRAPILAALKLFRSVGRWDGSNI